MTKILFTVGGQAVGGLVAGSKKIAEGIEVSDSIMRSENPQVEIGEQVSSVFCPQHHERAGSVIVDFDGGCLRLRIASLCHNSDWCDGLVGAIREALRTDLDDPRKT